MACSLPQRASSRPDCADRLSKDCKPCYWLPEIVPRWKLLEPFLIAYAAVVGLIQQVPQQQR